MLRWMTHIDTKDWGVRLDSAYRSKAWNLDASFTNVLEWSQQMIGTGEEWGFALFTHNSDRF